MAYPQTIFWLMAVSILISACAASSPEETGATVVTMTQSPTSPALREQPPPTTSLTATAVSPTATSLAAATATAIPLTIDPTISPVAAPSMPTNTASATMTVPPLRPTATDDNTEPESTFTTAVVDEANFVNGVPAQEIVIMPNAARVNIRRIFREGQQIGRNARAFSKLGDSITLTDHYLTRFDSGHYDLGSYSHLQSAIDFYNGSFSRFGVATKVGLHAWSLFDPLWADNSFCLPEENIAACEIRLHNPALLLIKIGSNDSGAGSVFEDNLRQLLDHSIKSGVIPVLATKADRFEGADDRNNRIIRQLAQEYEVPLWDYDRIAETLPRRGLSGDDVHLTMADADDYTKPETFERGYPVSDLTALMTLYEVMREVTAAGDS